VHLEDAGAGDERKGLAVFAWFEVGTILAILLLTAVATAAATATIAPALTGTAIVSSTTLAAIVVAVSTATTSAAPSLTLGHVTQSLNLLPATSIEIARGRKKENRMSEIEVRHLPAAGAARFSSS
jgi:hypothetical protein